MAMEQAKQFLTKLMTDGKLRKKLASKTPDEAAAFAKDLGFDVTSEERREAEQELRKESANSTEAVELTKDDLDEVAGGIFWFGDDAPDGHEIGCWVYWYDTIEDYYFMNGV